MVGGGAYYIYPLSHVELDVWSPVVVFYEDIIKYLENASFQENPYLLENLIVRKLALQMK